MKDAQREGSCIRITSSAESSDGSIKYTFSDEEGHFFEAINFLYEDTRGPEPKMVNTVCLSSQVGCGLGCTFCATGYGGFRSNLSAFDLFTQSELVQADLASRSRPAATAYAMMGMGEPLANYESMVGFFERVLEAGKVSKLGLSTVGLTPRIDQLTERKDLKINLTVSFHSPYDEERIKLIPAGLTYPLDGLVGACRRFSEAKERKTRASYLMFDNFNDSETHIRDFCRMLDPDHFEIKILLFNPIAEADFGRPSFDKAARFRDIATSIGYSAHIDVSRGRDVDGGCGQLARRAAEAQAHAPALPPMHPQPSLVTIDRK